MNLIKAVDIQKNYGNNSNLVRALDGVSFEVEKGEFITIVGTSGSGKSTLLNILAGLDKPDVGQISISGTNITKMSEKQLVAFRRRNVGFVFQDYNLISVLNAYDNIALPFTLDKIKRINHEYIEEVMKGLKIWDKQSRYPNELSGGQQQRVAIARALVMKPGVIFADEPTGNLDSRTALDVMMLLKQCNREFNQTLIVITHDEKIAQMGTRVIHLKDGRIVE